MELMDDDFSSLAEHVMNKELYKKSSPIYDEGCSPETEVPFTLLPGESPTNFCLCNNGNNLVVLTNYRLFASMDNGFYSVPIGLIESVELCHPADLLVLCKDCRSFKVFLETEGRCRSWLERLHLAIKPKSNFSDVFAFVHYAYKLDSLSAGVTGNVTHNKTEGRSKGASLLTSEYQRMGMGLSEMWRITECNTKYDICSSYPKLLIVPRAVTDGDLGGIAKFRSLARVPAVVWRHSCNGCVLVRCSQPLVGVLGWRCQEDEKFFSSLAISCTPRRLSTPSREPSNGTNHTNHDAAQNGCEELSAPSVLILDLRSYTAALGNRAKGGGCEHPDYYPDCEIRYKGLPNIHSVRKSFSSLRALLSQNSFSGNFLSLLEATQWMHNISQLLCTSVEVASTIHLEHRPVVVHCSDGWDRTAQVVALAEIILDPFYRTFEGFRVLVEREWLSFGHKFSDRCGMDSEQSPIFVQWLDCVYQLMNQFPTAFEFNTGYLIKLAHHCYSLLCGTFLLNCEQQREEHQIDKHTLSVWSLLEKEDNNQMRNVLYRNCQDNNGVLFPSWYPRDLCLWQELYISSHLIPYSTSPTPPRVPQDSPRPPTKNNNVPPFTDDEGVPPLLSNGSGSSSTNHHDPPSSNNPSTSNNVTINNPNVTINSSNGTINSPTLTSNNNNSRLVENNVDIVKPEIENNQDGGDDGRNGEHSGGVIQSSVFHSFHFESDAVNGGTSDIGNGEHKVLDMEDSFRVLDDALEPSLMSSSAIATKGVHSTNPELSLVSDCTTLLPNLLNKMDMSTYSECESRLRNLAEDGMKTYEDPIQTRVKEMEDQFQERISYLEEKVRRLTVMLRHKMDSSERKDGDGIDEVSSPVYGESPDNTNQPISPSNGWTHIDIIDTMGVQWIPDHAVSHCKQCGAEFWLGKRKHHCRNCGGVFCWKCSNYSCPVPKEQLYGNQRVCRNCFDRLDGYLAPSVPTQQR